MITTIEMDAGFRRHRKTLRLERSLGRDARWLPVWLWLYCIENARDGDLSKLSDDDLAAVLDWPEDGAKLRAALVSAGFLTEDGKAAGWEERYARRFAFYEERAKAAAAARWRTKQTPQKAVSDLTGPDLTGPDLRKHRQAFSKHASSKTDLQKRAEKLFRRRESTPWGQPELRAWTKNQACIAAATEDDWLALEAFYARPQSETFARKDLASFLNNFAGEIDRARAFLQPRQGGAVTAGAAPDLPLFK